MSLFRIGFSGMLSLTIFPVCVTSIYADSATMGASKDTTIQSDNVNRSNIGTVWKNCAGSSLPQLRRALP